MLPRLASMGIELSVTDLRMNPVPMTTMGIQRVIATGFRELPRRKATGAENTASMGRGRNMPVRFMYSR